MENNAEVMKFLYWEKSSRDTIDFKKSYVDMSEDLIAGLLLSQIVYWHLPSNETGKTKLRVRKEGHLWIAKGRDDWWSEIRITGRQFDRASGLLVKKGLVEKKRFKFNGSPMIHIRLIWENFLPRLDYIIYGKEQKTSKEPTDDMVFNERGKSILTKGENPFYTKEEMEFNERGRTLTESTAENTSKNTSKNLSINDSEKNQKIDRQIDAYSLDKNIKITPPDHERAMKKIQSIIENAGLPIPVSKPMMMYSKRVYEENIDVEDIKSMYLANKELLNDHQFGNILSNVLCETKGTIRNIKGLIHTSVKNYFKDVNSVAEQKANRRKEVIPDWVEEHKKIDKGDIDTEIREQEELIYNLKKGRNRFSDKFGF